MIKKDENPLEDCKYLVMNEPIRKIFATEEALLKLADEGPYMILYRSKPHSISIACNQSFDEVNLDVCTTLKADYSRRITGGGAVHHNFLTDISYAFITKRDHFLTENRTPDVTKAYRYFNGIVKDVLSYLGMPELKLDDKDIHFITSEGKKISGNAQFWPSENNAILHHGYILYNEPNFNSTFKMINSDEPLNKRVEQAKRGSTWITKRLGVDIDGVIDAFLERIPSSKTFLKTHQIKLRDELLETKYETDNWQKEANGKLTKEKRDCIRGANVGKRGAIIE